MHMVRKSFQATAEKRWRREWRRCRPNRRVKILYNSHWSLGEEAVGVQILE